MVKQYKQDAVEELFAKLQDKGNLILTNFTGTKVSDLNQLRRQLRGLSTEYKVVKNTLFLRVIDRLGYKDLGDFIKGPIAVAFTDGDLSDVAKLLKDFQKEHKQFSFSAGMMEDVFYNKEEIKRIADLPTKDELTAQIMSLFLGPAVGIAMLTSQVIASLARGIQAVAEKNNQ